MSGAVGLELSGRCSLFKTIVRSSGYKNVCARTDASTVEEKDSSQWVEESSEGSANDSGIRTESFKSIGYLEIQLIGNRRARKSEQVARSEMTCSTVV